MATLGSRSTASDRSGDDAQSLDDGDIALGGADRVRSGGQYIILGVPSIAGSFRWRHELMILIHRISMDGLNSTQD